MKAILVFILALSLFSMNQSFYIFNTFGNFISNILRSDILDIINCIVHNPTIIYDINVIIDAILTKNFDKIIAALIKVGPNIATEVQKCIHPSQGFLK